MPAANCPWSRWIAIRTASDLVELKPYLDKRRLEVERYLDRCLPTATAEPLLEAMRYSLSAGGKRLRPILALAACDAVGGPAAAVMPFACAIELIHTYSLIHDDLPAMDDDELRRGRPTNHVVYGEALAILAGDALLTEAFRLMADSALRATSRDPQRGLQVIADVAAAAGARGMVAGQAADMAAENRSVDLPTVELIHVRKTGALIRAAVRAGAIIGGADAKQLRALTRYADRIGLAFQVADDILDAEASTATTGKTAGRDEVRHKATYPALLGLSAAKERAHDLFRQAERALRPFGPEADALREIANYIVGRALG